MAKFERTLTTDTCYYTTKSAGGTPTVTTQGYVSRYHSRWRQNSPSYPGNGIDPLMPNPYSMEVITVQPGYFMASGSYLASIGKTETAYRNGSLLYAYSNGLWTSQGDSFPQAVANESSNKANLAAKDVKFEAGVAIGQIDQTVSLIGKTAKKIAGAYSALRKGHVWKAWTRLGLSAEQVPKVKSRLLRHALSKRGRIPKPSAKQLANHWLEFQFGWRPMVSDCVSAMSVLSDAYNDGKAEHILFWRYGYAKKEWSRSIRNVDSQSWSVPGAYTTCWLDRYDQYTATANTGYCFSVTSPAVTELQKLGISNAATIAWEATPFTFVVDWFVNVGDVIGQMDVWYGKKFWYGFQTTKMTVKRQLLPGKVDRASPVPTSSTSASAYGGIREETTLNRVTRSTAFPPRFVVTHELPSSTRALNAIALLKQLLS